MWKTGFFTDWPSRTARPRNKMFNTLSKVHRTELTEKSRVHRTELDYLFSVNPFPGYRILTDYRPKSHNITRRIDISFLL